VSTLREIARAPSVTDFVPVAPLGSPPRLFAAAGAGDLKNLAAALDKLTDVNSRDDTGSTALLLATRHGQTQAVKLLLANGADPNIADSQGITPLIAARAGGQAAIVRALQHAGAH
jgi:hypothetical protein